MPLSPNDEPVLEHDHLDHRILVQHVGNLIRSCEPPYVVGVCGAWGSGKTSFMRKLWAYQGGSFELREFDGKGLSERVKENKRAAKRSQWWSDYAPLPGPSAADGWHVIWFNPWHHQFEINPVVALLQEIRQHFSWTKKAFNEAGKLTEVGVYTGLNMLSEIGKAIHIPMPKAKDAMEYGTRYEEDHYQNRLTSQRFREFYEEAIRQVIGDKGRMIVFIDDLDRCEGEVAFKLLESLKLYLNARNCIYVLGLDQAHLEEGIARVLSGSDATSGYRPRARNYLNKMFQHLFLLPVRKSMKEYIRGVLEPQDGNFKVMLERHFALEQGQWPDLVVDWLDRSLPHNPRKIKSFVSAWKLNTRLIEGNYKTEKSLNWRLSLIMNYLGQFEEPLFRKVEESPGFYTDQIVKFCRDGNSTHPLFEGLELPYSSPAPPSIDPTSPAMRTPEEDAGGFDASDVPRTSDQAVSQVSGIAAGASSASGNLSGTGQPTNPQPHTPRTFWMRDLIMNVGPVGIDRVEQHLLGATAFTHTPGASS